MKNVTYISAGAGSGKTYTLTTKLAELIAKDKDDPEHVEPEQVILTTFTVKAANEFKEKAKAELFRIGKYDEASRLDHALMGTIDSVASTLIQKYWYTIGLSPKQGVMDDSAKATYINQSIANIPTDDDLHFFAKFRKAFNITGEDAKPDENFWKAHLKVIVEKSINFDISDYSASIEESLSVLRMLCNGINIHLEPSQRVAILEALITQVSGCRESGKKATTLKDAGTLQKNSRYMEDIEWLAEFARILGGTPSIPKSAAPIPILEDARQMATEMWQSQEVYDLQERYIKTIFRLAKEWNEQYTQYKLNKRIVDFCDIEHYMYKLLQDKEVAEEIGRTYTHLFVDEFQDCSPIQVKIFMALADVVKKSYWVGDTKQAIYGFRASDTELTKAVADVIAKSQGTGGCLSETLTESWRSVPPLVDACNKAFVEIFRPVFGEDTERQVPLKSAMLLHPDQFKISLADRAERPLRYLNIKDKRSPRSTKLSVNDVALYIQEVIENEGVAPTDIAVLGRAGYSLDDVQVALTKLRIPSDRETVLNKESKACQLMMALTTLTVNPQDDLAKAEIAYLTQDDMGVGAIIDSKLEYNNTPKEERAPWLAQTEMIARVNALRPSVMYQGIGALMETLAVELDVKNIMERWPEPIEVYMTDVKALIAAAKQYEERSSELAMPATPSGFKAFLDENDVELPPAGNGVQLLTYHGAKGLEWKYVFLLMDETMEPMDILRRELYGIHHFHPDQPSADNLYPQMSIRLMPWIFGSAKKVPDAISQPLFGSDQYEDIRMHCLAESARLLYVGMTRAAEVLVLVPWFAKKELDWLINVGLKSAGNIDGGDVLGIGVAFDVVEVSKPDQDEDTDDIVDDDDVVATDSKVYRHLDYHSDAPSDAALRTVAPSGVRAKADDVSVVFRSGQSIKINSGKMRGRSYSEVGDCIHNVYAAIEQLDKNEVEQLVRAHGMDDVLPNADEIIRAWEKLQDFLAQEFGAPESVYHERPFRRLQDDGSVVIGSIDYVYRTPKGTVLIDFKTFPQIEAVTDPTSEHFAGWYAGQLNAYTEALEADGEQVIRRYIYYPVSGMLVEVGKTGATPTEESHSIEESHYTEESHSAEGSHSTEEVHSTDEVYTIEMGEEAVALFRSGEVKHLQLTIDDSNKNFLLENIQGHLILVTDEMPMTYHGCYYWNGGVFPYAIKKDLVFRISAGSHHCLLKAVGHVTSVGQRFYFGEKGQPSVPDDNGSSCFWNVVFQVEPIDEKGGKLKTKTYLLRWNPAISSFKLDDYRQASEECPDGFCFNWSVYEWEEAHLGDRFFMLRTGDDHAGIVFRGVFTSEPYTGDDWAGKGYQRHYMEMNCYDCVPAHQKPSIDIEVLEHDIPGIDWRRGHSGQLLSDEEAERLEKLWKSAR